MCIYTHTYTHIPSGYLSELENHVVLFFKVNHQKTKGYIPTDIPQFYRDISTADPWLTLLQTNSMDVE